MVPDTNPLFFSALVPGNVMRLKALVFWAIFAYYQNAFYTLVCFCPDFNHGISFCTRFAPRLPGGVINLVLLLILAYIRYSRMRGYRV